MQLCHENEIPHCRHPSWVSVQPIRSLGLPTSSKSLSARLDKVHVGQDVELTTVDGNTLAGRVIALDGCRIELDSQQSEIHCDRIKLVKVVKRKRVKSPAMASHLTGGTKVVALVAVAVGLVVVLGIVAAKNTK